MGKQVDIRKQRRIQELQKKRQKRIIIYGADITKTTGNSKLILTMAKAFQMAGHWVATIAYDFNGVQRYKENIPVLPSFFCENCGYANKGSDLMIKKIADYLNGFHPIDYFICVGDPSMFQEWGLGKLKLKGTIQMMYSTLDSENYYCNRRKIQEGLPDYLDDCDMVISNSKWSAHQLKKWKDWDSDVIYNPVNAGLYVPATPEQKKEIRKKYRLPEDSFIIYSGGRNILRKRHNILLMGVAKFLAETEKTYLFLNIPTLGYTTDTDEPIFPDILNPLDFIQTIIKKKFKRDFYEEGRIRFLRRGDLGDTTIDEQQNVELYQMSDLFAYTTGAESFGLMPAESMACEVPVVIPSAHTGYEIAGDIPNGKMEEHFVYAKGGLLSIADHPEYVDYSTVQNVTSPEYIYHSVKYMYEHPEEREKMGKSGREHVKKMFSPEDFRVNWLKVIDSTKKKDKSEGFKNLEAEIKDKNLSKEEDKNGTKRQTKEE